MKVKPKEVLVNLPIVLMFEDDMKVAEFAANINTLIHGKVKVKCEELGMLGGSVAAIFYLQRNGEFTELRQQFMEMIEREEMRQDSLPEGFEYSKEAKESLRQRAEEAGEELDRRASRDSGLKERLDGFSIMDEPHPTNCRCTMCTWPM